MDKKTMIGPFILVAGIMGCAESLESAKEASVDSPKPNIEKVANEVDSVTIPLGDTETLTTLYSYPNSDDGESLEATIEHYLAQRVERDLIAQGTVDVVVKDGFYSAVIGGDSDKISDYKIQLSTFLNNGKVAAQGVEEIKAAGKWDDKEWRFFLPLGLSIVNQRSVQLLHFPPDYSLPDQDYLNSKTSLRWESLLELNKVPESETTLYESILDIAPIAAPASAGETLSDTYTYFEPYVLKMLPLLLDIDEGASTALPIVAYGGPVRDWVSDYYKLNNFAVNTVADIAVTDSVSAPILGANHPSYIWYAKEQGRDYAFKVMKQDLISACWQASMGSNPIQKPKDVLNTCSTNWDAQPYEVCVNMEIQAYSKSEKEAAEICKDDPPSKLVADN